MCLLSSRNLPKPSTGTQENREPTGLGVGVESRTLSPSSPRKELSNIRNPVNAKAACCCFSDDDDDDDDDGRMTGELVTGFYSCQALY